jgi:hypothetical protein
MAIYADYTTIQALRKTYLSASENTRDDLLGDLIRAASRNIDAIGCRAYYPRVETRYYDTPRGAALILDDDLLEVTTLTDGSAGALASTDYRLYPRNESAKNEVRLTLVGGKTWQTDSDGDPDSAVSIAGIWGFHTRYDSAWAATGAALTTAATSTSATSIYVTTGKLDAGDLVKIGSEMMHVSAVARDSADTATVVRAINGTTAATHSTSAEVLRWTFDEVEHVCKTATAAMFRLRNNPIGETVNVGGETFETPKDVNAYIERQLGALELIRVNFG